MTPITKDPKRRIRRIQRWIKRSGISNKSSSVIDLTFDSGYTCRLVNQDRYIDRTCRANLLFKRELAWLCDYAIRITTDHGRVASRLGEVEGALGRMRSMVHRVVPGLSPYSTHATMAYALERAIGEIEELRDEKKRES